MKLLYFDTETTGLDPAKNDIIQIAGIVEIDGAIVETFEIKCQPFSYDSISQQALDVNNITVDMLKTFYTPQFAYRKLLGIFDKYVNKYNKSDKLIPVGHNVKFDMDFLKQFFLKNNDKYFGSYIDYHFIDTMPLAGFFNMIGKMNTPNLKLVTVASAMNIQFNAHDAVEDIKATREVLLSFKQFIK